MTPRTPQSPLASSLAFFFFLHKKHQGQEDGDAILLGTRVLSSCGCVVSVMWDKI